MSAITAPTHQASEAELAGVRVPISWRDPIVTTVMAALAVLLAATSSGHSNLSFKGASAWMSDFTWTAPAQLTTGILAVIAVCVTVLVWIKAVNRQKVPGWTLIVVGVAFVFAFLVWIVADRPSANLPVVSLLAGGLAFATPLVFGALAGVINERSGTVNIAIEGQLLFGAFAGAITASAFGSPWMGLIGAPIAGMLLAALLALFTIKYRADHIVVGVVLNMLALGVTSFIFSTLLRDSPHLNKAMKLPPLPIPILKDIPIIGPVLFNQTILVYMMYAAVIILQFALFSTRWGLRMRSVGEKPQAADTVGIKVNSIRWHNVLLGGAVAGLGGAFFTVGQGLAFSKDMAAGNGFIALAAMILGRYNPVGALMAALLFGFSTNLGIIMQAVGGGIPAEYLLMIPYLVTILAVAGFVGAVRVPAAEGKPYP